MSHNWKVGDRAKLVWQCEGSIAMFGDRRGKEGTVVAIPGRDPEDVCTWQPDAGGPSWGITKWSSLTPLLPPDEKATDEAASLFVERIKRQVAQDMGEKVREKEEAR